MAMRPIVVSALLFMVIATGLFKVYSLFYRPAIHELNPDLQWLGVIDFDNAQDISLHSVLNGEDAILVMDHSALTYQKLIQQIPQAKYFTMEELFNLNNFHLVDSNNNGVITAQDPIFEHLYVLKFYNSGAQNDIKSLGASGIRAIYINAQTADGSYQVLMADGTRRKLINASKFEKTTD
jgi:hypothetical protein